MAIFETEIVVRFADCDPSGIVFYPRYFDMAHLAVERFFEERLNWSFVTLQKVEGVTVPLAKTEATVLDPCWLEERLVLHLQIVHLGRSTVTIAIDVLCDGQKRVSLRKSLVCMQVGQQKSSPWPIVLRSAMEMFQED